MNRWSWEVCYYEEFTALCVSYSVLPSLSLCFLCLSLSVSLWVRCSNCLCWQGCWRLYWIGVGFQGLCLTCTQALQCTHTHSLSLCLNRLPLTVREGEKRASEYLAAFRRRRCCSTSGSLICWLSVPPRSPPSFLLLPRSPVLPLLCSPLSPFSLINILLY